MPAQWSRPALALILGVRPISPQQTSRILSRNPRASTSSMNAHRVVERPPNVAHALDHRGVVLIGVHVPDEVGGDGDEAGAALGQPTHGSINLQDYSRAQCIAVGCSTFANAIDAINFEVSTDQLDLFEMSNASATVPVSVW